MTPRNHSLVMLIELVRKCSTVCIGSTGKSECLEELNCWALLIQSVQAIKKKRKEDKCLRMFNSTQGSHSVVIE